MGTVDIGIACRKHNIDTVAIQDPYVPRMYLREDIDIANLDIATGLSWYNKSCWTKIIPLKNVANEYYAVETIRSFNVPGAKFQLQNMDLQIQWIILRDWSNCRFKASNSSYGKQK